MAIKQEFETKPALTPEEQMIYEHLLGKLKRAKGKPTKVRDIIEPRFRWLQGNHDRGDDKLKEVNMTVAKGSLYGYGGFLIPVKHPKYDEMMLAMWEVFDPYFPQTKLVKGARRGGTNG